MKNQIPRWRPPALPAIFDILEHTPPGYNGEIQLTDALRSLAQVEDIYATEVDAERFDVGNVLGLIEATIEFALRRADLSASLREYLERRLSYCLAEPRPSTRLPTVAHH